MDRPTGKTIRLEDMRLFAALASSKSFTAAAATLGIPKQTLSHRIAALEEALGVTLVHRTTRRLQLSEVGAVYAERCTELARFADEANRAVLEAQDSPRGTLRITADPVFGRAFLTELVLEYARRWPEVQVEVVLTRRKVALLEERFDVAFRVGEVDDPSLSGIKLAQARVMYCASPAYLTRRGTPKTPVELTKHDALVVSHERAPMRWPFRSARGIELVNVHARMRFSSFEMARAAALAGLGIAIFPAFACAEEVRRGQLVPVLEAWVVPVGNVWLLHASRRFLPARVRAFLDLARESFARDPFWQKEVSGAFLEKNKRTTPRSSKENP